MIRNLKMLGLALVAVFALSAVAASAAMAVEEHPGTLTSDGPVTGIGTQTGAGAENALTAFGGETQCSTAKYTIHKYNVTPHVLVPNDVSTFTVTPHYGPCVALGFPATIDMNGCDYDFHLLETSEPPTDKYGIRAFVTCPQGAHITLTLFGSATKHTNNEPFCHITITENAAGYLGLSATDTTNGKIDITGTITGIEADKKSPTGSILCPEATTTTATLKQDVTVEGKNAEGGETKISISHT